MAFKRKYAKKNAKRKIVRRKKKAWTTTKVFRVKQIIDQTTFSTNAVAAVGIAYAFTLSQLDQSTTLTSLFDQYRVVKLTYKFRPQITEGYGGNNIIGVMYSVVDYDDDASPASVASMREFSNCREHSMYKPFSRTFVPHCADALYSGAFTSFGNRTKPWIDSGSPGVKHYGVKLVSAGSGVVQSFTVETIAHVEFKNVR